MPKSYRYLSVIDLLLGALRVRLSARSRHRHMHQRARCPYLFRLMSVTERVPDRKRTVPGTVMFLISFCNVPYVALLHVYEFELQGVANRKMCTSTVRVRYLYKVCMN